ncbi:MAG: hypothetical protein EBZ77_08420 [Chitinophagia bacterium]|nr:hypothetical protein [Chitinophagia bacterium]
MRQLFQGYLIFISICILVPAACAQQSGLANTWYAVHNKSFPWCRGSECTVVITQTAHGYQLAHNQRTYTDHLPPEGVYTPNRAGQWQQGTTRLWLKDGFLYTNYDGLMAFEPETVFQHSGEDFSVAANLIDSAQADSLREPFYLQQALPLLHRLIGREVYCVECYVNRSICYLMLQHTDSALADYQRAYRLDSSYALLGELKAGIVRQYRSIAWEQYGKKGQFATAEVILRKALKIDEGNAELWYDIGGSAYSCKHFRAAITAFSRTLALNPAHPQARAGLQAALEAAK